MRCTNIGQRAQGERIMALDRVLEQTDQVVERGDEAV